MSSMTAADLFRTWPSPLAGFENAPPLPDERAADGKSFKNPETGILSPAYSQFPDPLDRGRRGGFDVHIYYFQNNPMQVQYARELWERIRREFPELRIYRLWPQPVGPHTVAMFEVNLFTPAQFGAFVPWLVVWRGPLSVLIHPNTVEEGLGKLEIELRNHGERAIWMGERLPLDWAGAARFASRSAYESGSGPESKSGDGDREARTTTTETGNGGNCRSERGGSGGDSNQNSSE